MELNSPGRSLLGWIVLTPFMLVGLAIALIILGVLLCEANKAYWDYRIIQMCEEDKGEIFEHIEVTKKEFAQMTKLGLSIGIRYKKHAQLSDIVFVDIKDSILHSHFPRVERSDVIIKRLVDEKIMARFVSYARVGGDFPTGIAHNSSYRCTSSNFPQFEINNIFRIKEK